MSKSCIKVTTLHGYSIEELQSLQVKSSNAYTRGVLLAVIMRYTGTNTKEIMNALGKSRVTITKYINAWNDSPNSIIDNRGGNVPSKLTDEILDDIKYIVANTSPKDFNYEQSNWTSVTLAKYVAEKHGLKYSKNMMFLVLKSLGFSYKRGLYVPTKGDPEIQEQFKKNGYHAGYF